MSPACLTLRFYPQVSILSTFVPEHPLDSATFCNIVTVKTQVHGPSILVQISAQHKYIFSRSRLQGLHTIHIPKTTCFSYIQNHLSATFPIPSEMFITQKCTIPSLIVLYFFFPQNGSMLCVSSTPVPPLAGNAIGRHASARGKAISPSFALFHQMHSETSPYLPLL